MLQNGGFDNISTPSFPNVPLRNKDGIADECLFTGRKNINGVGDRKRKGKKGPKRHPKYTQGLNVGP